MGRANHIGQDHGFDALEFAGKSHLCGHFAAAVGVVAAVAVPVNVPSVSPVALRFFAVEEGDPDVEKMLSRAEQARQFDHGSGAGAAIIGSDKVGYAYGVVVRGVENDSGVRAMQLDHNVFHRQIAENRRSVKIVLLDRAAVAFELADNVGLRSANAVRIRRPRPNLYEMPHVFVCAGPVECGVYIGRELSSRSSA